MSAEAVGWVYRHSPYEGQTLAVHLAVADSVSDQHGNEFWMVLPKLATKARVNRGTAKRSLDRMCADGLLDLLRPSSGGRGRPAVYRFLFPDLPVVFETRVSGAGSGETRASHAKPAHEAPKPACHARGIDPKEPNEQNAGARLVCRCGARFDAADPYSVHIETCVVYDDLEFIPADQLTVIEGGAA